MRLNPNRLSFWFPGLAFVFFMLLASPAQASPAITGSVSFNAATGIYTYSYTIDNIGGTGPMFGFSLQISPGYSDFYPLSYTMPPGWDFTVGSVAGGSCQEFGECGAFWSWEENQNGVLPGESLSGFSFQTTVAPSTSAGNDYFTFDGSVDNIYDAVFGNVVVPNYTIPPPPPPQVPESPTVLLVATGFVGVFVSAFRQKL